MPCTRPLAAYRAPGGGIVFNSKEGYGDRPLELRCGQCLDCRLERTRSWAIRCTNEAQMHEANSFITLTYDEEHLPSDLSLDVDHWQRFVKRLRKKLGPVRYLHCGEYGSKNQRPHYHAILFGQDFSHDRTHWRNTDGGQSLYVSETLNGLWPYGFSTIGEVTFDSAAYVAQYCIKKVNGDLASERYGRTNIETGEYWEVRPEYATMSRNPGIGRSFIEKYIDDVYPDDFVVAKGQKFRPPRYYDQVLEERDPAMFEELQRRRIARAKQNEEDNTPARLRVKERVHEAKYKLGVRAEL